MHKSLKIMLIPLALTLAACGSSDDSTMNTTVNVESSKDNTKSQAEFDDVLNIAEDDIKYRAASGRSAIPPVRGINPCATITLNIDTVTIDFGSAGTCEFHDRARKGKVIYQFTGGYFVEGSVITVTLENYEVQNTSLSNDFIAIEGQQVVTNLGLVDGKMAWSIIDSNGLLTYPNGSTQSWDSNRTRILFDVGTILPFDETYHVYGTAEGINKAGVSYTAVTTDDDPLVVDVACALTTLMPIDGTITVSSDQLTDRIIDFGYQADDSEACDRSFSVTIGKLVLHFNL